MRQSLCLWLSIFGLETHFAPRDHFHQQCTQGRDNFHNMVDLVSVNVLRRMTHWIRLAAELEQVEKNLRAE